MIGVVIWSDGTANKAVIWCEDHGHLAFYRRSERSLYDGADLDAGDLVQFEFSETPRMRIAHNPRVVAEEEYPTLANDLVRARAAYPGPGSASNESCAARPNASANVVDLFGARALKSA